jgi:lysylphosphatidylglycerol synthase-like protein
VAEQVVEPLGTLPIRAARRLQSAAEFIRGSPVWRQAIGIASALSMVVLFYFAARHFATTSWPLTDGHPAILIASGLLLLLAQAFKAMGWGRLFARAERPPFLALAAGNGGAALIGLVLPGRFDEAMRIAVVRRYPGCPANVYTLAFSLVMLGLIDSVALAPLATAAFLVPNGGNAVQVGLAVVAVGGIGAAAVVATLPRLAASRRAKRFRLGRWAGPRTTSLRNASDAWGLVSACWIIRALAVFLVLGTLGMGFSLSLALLFLCAGAAAAALPLGLAGTATQVGAGVTALVASGIGASEAFGAAVSFAALGVFSGAAVLLIAIGWRTGLFLRGRLSTA